MVQTALGAPSRSLLTAFVAALFLVCPTLLLGNDFRAFLIGLALTPLITLAVFGIGVIWIRRRPVAVLTLWAAFALVSWLGHRFGYTIHDEVRWLALAHRYKARLLAMPDRQDGLLRHVEWDGWGLAGSDTTVYLAYDPADLFSSASESASSKAVAGLPCPVARVMRQENHWYKVVFYTNSDWEHCPEPA